mmetsp:Transcript_11188/g.31752  ORF Transcript_11188/g.31752 Transcript_11188/m.31752 type:complete len:100 (-) Transcript_11188:10-309(-)
MFAMDCRSQQLFMKQLHRRRRQQLNELHLIGVNELFLLERPPHIDMTTVPIKLIREVRFAELSLKSWGAMCKVPNGCSERKMGSNNAEWQLTGLMTDEP